jgi:hypothetical protein
MANEDQILATPDEICPCGGAGTAPTTAIDKVVAQTEGKRSCCEPCPECGGARIRTECLTFHRAMHAKHKVKKTRKR